MNFTAGAQLSPSIKINQRMVELEKMFEGEKRESPRNKHINCEFKIQIKNTILSSD